MSGRILGAARKKMKLARDFPQLSVAIADSDEPLAVATSIGSVIGFIGGGSSNSSSASSAPFCSEYVKASVSSGSGIVSSSNSGSDCSVSPSSSSAPSSPGSSSVSRSASDTEVDTRMDAVAVVNAEMETEALLKGRDCSAPLGNLNRFSETFFFKEDRSQDVCTIEIAVDVVAVVAVAVGVVVGGDFSTLPWLSLRNGGGSHFLL